MGALDELLAELGDDRQLLLADRLDALVGTGQLDAAQPVEDPHHLLLVDHHAVGLFEDLLHHRVRILGLLAAVLDLDVVVDHAAFQRAGRYSALVAMMSRKWSGFIRCSRSRMPPLSSWKIPFVSPRQKQGERLLVVQRELVRVDPLAGGLLDQPTTFERIVRFRSPRKSIFSSRPSRRRPWPIG